MTDIYDSIAVALEMQPIEFHFDREDEMFTQTSGITECRKGIGGVFKGTVPWNKGLDASDPRVKKNGQNTRKTRCDRGYTAWNKGVPNPNARLSAIKGSAKLSAIAEGRKRVYNEDGTWRWGKAPSSLD